MTTGAQRESRTKRSFLALLVLAALSGVIKDADSFRESVSGLSGPAISWLRAGSTVYVSAISLAERSCSELLRQVAESADRSHGSGHVAPGQSIETKGTSDDIVAAPTMRREIGVTATKKARRSNPPAVTIQVVHIGRYSSNQTRTCSNPAAVTIQVMPYAANGDITAKLADANCPDSLEFKTINGRISWKHINGTIGTGGRGLVLKTLKEAFASAERVGIRQSLVSRSHPPPSTFFGQPLTTN